MEQIKTEIPAIKVTNPQPLLSPPTWAVHKVFCRLMFPAECFYSPGVSGAPHHPSQCLPLPQAGGVLGLCCAQGAEGQQGYSPASLWTWMGWDLLAELSGAAGALKYPTEERNSFKLFLFILFIFIYIIILKP